MHKTIILLACCMLLGFPSGIEASGSLDCHPLKKVFNGEITSKNNRCTVEIKRNNFKILHLGEKLSTETIELVFHFAFEKTGEKTAVIGELALKEDELNSVIDVLREGGITVSAVHNHMIMEKPRVMYLHFQDIGQMKEQAKVIK